ncbi:MAG: hypothetical protein U0Q22_15105 [Acidimicrobiales bacterium]
MKFRRSIVVAGGLVAALTLTGCPPDSGGGGGGTTTTTAPPSVAPLTRRQPFALTGLEPSGAETSVSNDGRKVVFESDTKNLVTGINDGKRLVYVWDPATDTVRAQPPALGGARPNGVSFNAVVSGDGSVVVFESDSTNLTADADLAGPQLFVWNLATNSVRRSPVPVKNSVSLPSVSANGKRVAFTTMVDNPAGPIVIGDEVLQCELAAVWNVDDDSIVTQPVDVGFSWQDCAAGERVAVSPDGRYVAFDSDTDSLISGDTNATTDVFVWDTTAGGDVVRMLPGGVEPNGMTGSPSISNGGTYVAFESDATNLVAGRGAGVYVWNRSTGAVVPEPLGTHGETAMDLPATPPVISGDGSAIVFASATSWLVPGDTNSLADVFIWSRDLGTVSRITGIGGANLVGGPSEGPRSISADGRYVPFNSKASNVVENRAAGTTVDQAYLLDRSAPLDGGADSPPVWLDGAAITRGGTGGNVKITWPGAYDDRAVTSYTVKHDDTTVATLPSTARTYTYSGLPTGTSTVLSVLAEDAVGHQTPLSITLTPGEIAISGAVKVSGNCALLNTGTVKCWGSNSSGQLGNGTTVDSPTAVQVSGLFGATSIASSGSHACATVTSGQVKCWGLNSSGQLGDGTKVNSSTPVIVSGLTGATAVAIGRNYSCAIVSGGSVKCWGDDLFGTLGDGATTTGGSVTPVPVDGIVGATALAAGGTHTCAIVTAGAAKCWGANPFGELGNGATSNASASPVDVVGLSGATTISASGSWLLFAGGSEHTCVTMSDTTMRCWGGNRTGQLGTGSSGGSTTTPVVVAGMTGAVASSTSDRFSFTIGDGPGSSCALLSTGSVKCWGDNSGGQIGNGSTGVTPVLVPSTVAGLSDVTAIDGTCAVAGGGVKCWGGTGIATSVVMFN